MELLFLPVDITIFEMKGLAALQWTVAVFFIFSMEYLVIKGVFT